MRYIPVLLLIAATAEAQSLSGISASESKRHMDEKYGFRDMRFEADTASIKGLHYLFSEGPVRYYSRPLESLMVGNAALHRITYGFVNGKLAEVALETRGSQNTKLVREAFQAEYGDGCTVCGPSYYWGSKKERIRIEESGGDGSFMIYSKALLKDEQAARMQAGRKAAATGL